MMKRIFAVLFVVAFVSSCCGQGSSRRSAVRSTEVFNDDDSVLFERHWNNPEYYVFDRPSEDKIAEWKMACEKLDPEWINTKIPAEDAARMPFKLAFEDCMFLGGSDSSDEFLLWRMNELLPPDGNLDGEVQRYNHFCLQIDTLKSAWWNTTSLFELNMGASLSAKLAGLKARIYSSKLRTALPLLSKVLEQEELAYNSFYKATNNSYEKCTMSMNDSENGVSSPMAYEGFAEDTAYQRCRSIIPFYLFLTDPENAPKVSIHARIPDQVVSDEYAAFRKSVFQPLEHSYPLEEQRSCLTADQKAWNEWMRTRNNVSALLSGDEKEVWDNCTNNLKRSHLIVLKNRYEGYGAMSQEMFDRLILEDISDELLLGQ